MRVLSSLLRSISLAMYSARPEPVEGRALTLRQAQGERGTIRRHKYAEGCLVLVAALTVAPPAVAGAADPEAPVPAEIVSPTSVGEVAFPHRKHFEELQLACAACHHETRAAVLDMPHPQYFADFWIDCKVCHREASAPQAPQACATCHRSSLSNIADQTSSAKVAIHRSCWTCHPSDSGEKATANCTFCHNRERIAAPAAAAGVK